MWRNTIYFTLDSFSRRSEIFSEASLVIRRAIGLSFKDPQSIEGFQTSGLLD